MMGALGLTFDVSKALRDREITNTVSKAWDSRDYSHCSSLQSTSKPNSVT